MRWKRGSFGTRLRAAGCAVLALLGENAHADIPDVVPPPGHYFEASLAVPDQNETSLGNQAIAIGYDTLLISASSAPIPDGQGATGVVYAFHRQLGTQWALEATLTAPDEMVFGGAVAMHGSRALIGSPHPFGSTSTDGRVRVLRRGLDGVWQTEQLLHPSPGETAWGFGRAVRLQGDWAFVGVPDGPAGALYVFHRSFGLWEFSQRLTAPFSDQLAQNGRYGASLAGSGDLLFVGAPGIGGGVGAVIVYRRTGTTWVHQQTLTPQTLSLESFGASLAVDGASAAIGAPGWMGGVDGKVYVFRSNASGTWSVETELTNPAAQASAFGTAVDLRGTRLVASASSGPAPTTFVYERNGDQWTSPATLPLRIPQIASDMDVLGLVEPPLPDGGTGATVYLLRKAIATQTQITALSPSPVTLGQAYVVTAEVTGSGAQPGGVLLVSDGDSTCSIHLPANSCALNAAGDVGPRAVVVDFVPADGFGPSSDHAEQVVLPECSQAGGNADGDLLCDAADPDDDNDDIPDETDPCPLDPTNQCVPPDCSDLGGDTDGDGVCNNTDPDDDNDDLPDGADPCPLDPMNQCVPPPDCSDQGGDTDGDGICNSTDPDDDNDDLPDGADPCPLDPMNQCVPPPDCSDQGGDTDGDGICNSVDPDDDNDGLLDNVDPCPLDPMNQCVPPPDCSGQGGDTDGDGICNSVDPDDDNDGLLDNVDPCPLDPMNQCVPPPDCSDQGGDTDGDGICNSVDPDDDNDGSDDGIDPCPADATDACPHVDVRITKTDGRTSVAPGMPLTYVIIATNAGTSLAQSVNIVDMLPSLLVAGAWTCSTDGTGAAACPQASGVGDIDLALDIAPGQFVEIVVEATVATDAEPGATIVNAVAATAANLADEPMALRGDNVSNDADLVRPIEMFSDGFE